MDVIALFLSPTEESRWPFPGSEELCDSFSGISFSIEALLDWRRWPRMSLEFMTIINWLIEMDDRDDLKLRAISEKRQITSFHLWTHPLLLLTHGSAAAIWPYFLARASDLRRGKCFNFQTHSAINYPWQATLTPPVSHLVHNKWILYPPLRSSGQARAVLGCRSTFGIAHNNVSQKIYLMLLVGQHLSAKFFGDNN